ncbi:MULTISPECIES: hypothetical protein [Cryobacterium]|uniref:Uncharacterized protein n=1 Tax=Cryobacterium breve TaxID=1259258 RepID=A0ABY2IWA9_9MICO|nr:MULTISPECIES: hypothetical protein [Cryobacterium]TFC94021.1 hypothetical protein E3T20_09210 [Cryobacterium sp. TmT3-12]TFC94691.1 hypothetical protein E3O65_16510 [Cryobacterium breve]
MKTANFQALRRAVADASTASKWKTGILEWEVTSVEEHPTSEGECVCGQTNLLWMYTITNTDNGAELFPIGSTCVNHFERTDLNRQIAVFRKLVDIRSAAREGRQIALTAEYFSRAVLDYLYDVGVFTPDQYNENDGWNDWEFLRKMFGVRDKTDISPKRQRKIRKILDQKIVPFVLSI